MIHFVSGSESEAFVYIFSQGVFDSCLDPSRSGCRHIAILCWRISTDLIHILYLGSGLRLRSAREVCLRFDYRKLVWATSPGKRASSVWSKRTRRECDDRHVEWSDTSYFAIIQLDKKTIYPNLILIIEEEHILLMRGDKRFKDPQTVEQKIDEI